VSATLPGLSDIVTGLGLRGMPDMAALRMPSITVR
jgi:hypothetical protein